MDIAGSKVELFSAFEPLALGIPFMKASFPWERLSIPWWLSPEDVTFRCIRDTKVMDSTNRLIKSLRMEFFFIAARSTVIILWCNIDIAPWYLLSVAARQDTVMTFTSFCEYGMMNDDICTTNYRTIQTLCLRRYVSKSRMIVTGGLWCSCASRKISHHHLTLTPTPTILASQFLCMERQIPLLLSSMYRMYVCYSRGRFKR